MSWAQNGSCHCPHGHQLQVGMLQSALEAHGATTSSILAGSPLGNRDRDGGVTGACDVPLSSAFCIISDVSAGSVVVLFLLCATTAPTGLSFSQTPVPVEEIQLPAAAVLSASWSDAQNRRIVE